tara:strand:- start:993 stop:1592 length:600 start_codon:yes stop_codon:yes gene_type:complete
MFLKKIFKNPKTVLIGEINLSNNSSSFNIHEVNKPVEDKELILLSLLVYARILRVLVPKKEKDELLALYGDFYHSFRSSSNQIETINGMMTILNIISKPLYFKSRKKLKLKKIENENVYLDMGTITVDPITSVVHTVFIYAFNNISSKKNKIHLLEGMTTLASIYREEKFTVLSATEWPNTIVNEAITFNEKSSYEINF